MKTLRIALKAEGFGGITSAIVRIPKRETPTSQIAKITSRNTSALRALDEDAFRAGLNTMARYLEVNPNDAALFRTEHVFY